MSEPNLITLLSSNLPPLLAAQLENLLAIADDARSILNDIIRFVSGVQPTDLVTQQISLAEWETKQAAFSTEVFKLKQTRQLKRYREDEDSSADGRSGEPSSNKRKRTDDAGKTSSLQPDSEDKPLYTLHAISVTSPIRKKCDMTIHSSSIRFINPTSQALETSVPVASLKRAFILPTKGKQKPHWTVVLMSTDVTETGKKAAPDASNANAQIIFGMDANPAAVFKYTDYSSSSDAVSLPKSSPSLPPIQSFLSHLPESTKPIIRPSTSVFSSKLSDSSGVDTYRSAKAGTLWFLKEGILWGESKPCEFWALEDLHGEGLRMLSATGRTCSVYLIRRPPPSEEEEFGDEGIETEFSMVDGKEQDAIREWVQKYRSSFGVKSGQQSNGSSSSKDATDASKPAVAASQAVAGPTSIRNMVLGSDSEDEDYDTDSDNSHGGSSGSNTSSDSDLDDSDAEDGDGEDGSASGDEAQESDGGDGEEEEFDPARHPLMRPGAVPRMSRAAMSMVVSMVEDDLMGEGTADAPLNVGSDEEDELS